MKNLFCLFIAVLFCLTNINGQQQQKRISLQKETSMDAFAKSVKAHLSVNYDLHFPGTKTNLDDKRSIEWNWDTIIAYDTLGLMQRLARTYDAGGNVLAELTQNRETNTWLNLSRITYTYDANGNMLTELIAQWQSNTWVNSRRSTYTYDANGNMLTHLGEIWSSNAWVNSSRETYTYASNGNLLTLLNENWESNAWVNDSRTTYTYDANGNMMTEVIEYWESGAWVNSLKYSYTYSNGNLITMLIQLWETNAWINFMKGTYTYDANGNPVNIVVQIWQIAVWMNFMKMTNTYDGNGNNLTSVLEMWQGTAWYNDSRMTYSYDANGNSITGKYETWENNSWVPDMSSLEVFSQKQSIYYLNDVYRYEAGFISYITGLASKDYIDNCLTVFPNPSSEKITIKISGQANNIFSSIIIYGMDGRVMAMQQINGPGTDINVGSFPPGLYFIRVIGKERIESGKFIKN